MTSNSESNAPDPRQSAPRPDQPATPVAPGDQARPARPDAPVREVPIPATASRPSDAGDGSPARDVPSLAKSQPTPEARPASTPGGDAEPRSPRSSAPGDGSVTGVVTPPTGTGPSVGPPDVLGTPMSPTATTVMVLGAGELGKELVIAFQRLGVEVVAVDRYDGAPGQQLAHHAEVVDMTDADALVAVIEKYRPQYVVPEIEAIATDALSVVEQRGLAEVIPTAAAVIATMNREGIRRLADEDLGLPTSPYLFAGSLPEMTVAVKQVGYPCVVKPVMSSSGKGQTVIRGPEEIAAAWETATTGGRVRNERVIVEGFIDFDYEITLLTVRAVDPATGRLTTHFCAPIGHSQVDGDYVESWQPHEMSADALASATSIAARIATALGDGKIGGRGIFGVELFVKGDDVYFSEVSPRPHDTGLVTMATQRLSEFEMHARAILGLPVDVTLASPGASAVIYGQLDEEAIGFTDVARALAVPETDIRLFGKPESFHRRRMGVVTATADDIETARERAVRAASTVTPVSGRPARRVVGGEGVPNAAARPGASPAAPASPVSSASPAPPASPARPAAPSSPGATSAPGAPAPGRSVGSPRPQAGSPGRSAPGPQPGGRPGPAPAQSGQSAQSGRRGPSGQPGLSSQSGLSGQPGQSVQHGRPAQPGQPSAGRGPSGQPQQAGRPGQPTGVPGSAGGSGSRPPGPGGVPGSRPGSPAGQPSESRGPRPPTGPRSGQVPPPSGWSPIGSGPAGSGPAGQSPVGQRPGRSGADGPGAGQAPVSPQPGGSRSASGGRGTADSGATDASTERTDQTSKADVPPRDARSGDAPSRDSRASVD